MTNEIAEHVRNHCSLYFMDSQSITACKEKFVVDYPTQLQSLFAISKGNHVMICSNNQGVHHIIQESV